MQEAKERKETARKETAPTCLSEQLAMALSVLTGPRGDLERRSRNGKRKAEDSDDGFKEWIMVLCGMAAKDQRRAGNSNTIGLNSGVIAETVFEDTANRSFGLGQQDKNFHLVLTVGKKGEQGAKAVVLRYSLWNQRGLSTFCSRSKNQLQTAIIEFLSIPDGNKADRRLRSVANFLFGDGAFQKVSEHLLVLEQHQKNAEEDAQLRRMVSPQYLAMAFTDLVETIFTLRRSSRLCQLVVFLSDEPVLYHILTGIHCFRVKYFELPLDGNFWPRFKEAVRQSTDLVNEESEHDTCAVNNGDEPEIQWKTVPMSRLWNQSDVSALLADRHPQEIGAYWFEDRSKISTGSSTSQRSFRFVCTEVYVPSVSSHMPTDEEGESCFYERKL